MIALVGGDVPQCYVDNDWVCAQYWHDYRPELVDATVQHLWHHGGLGAARPAGRVPAGAAGPALPAWLESIVVGTTTRIYTIPSLALFSLLLPFTGLSATTVVIGLALYSLTILVRNILEGLQAVPDDVRESARGMGYGRPPAAAAGSSCRSRCR